MHFILSPLGSAGDVHPYVGLALAMRKRGHRVTFLISGYFSDLMERYDFEWHDLLPAKEFERLTMAPELWHPQKALGYIFEHSVKPNAPRQAELIRQTCETESIVLSSCLGIGALIAREKYGIPLITVHLQPSVLWSNINPPKLPGLFGPIWMQRLQFAMVNKFIVPRVASAPVNQVRAQFGLGPIRDLMTDWNSPDGILCLFPEWFAPPQDDWPQKVIQTDFPLWDAGQDRALDSRLQSFLDAGAPPIAFTPGTANRFGKQFFEHAKSACRELGQRGILLSKFADQIPALPDGIIHVPYAPFELLLPHCRALVHHGGIGTTAQAFRAGIPQLIVALAHDQFDNGDRVQRLGTGDWISSRRFNKRTALERIRRVLHSQIATTAKRVAQRSTVSGCEAAVTKLEAHFPSEP